MAVRYIDITQRPKDFQSARYRYEQEIASCGINIIPISHSRYIAFYNGADFDKKLNAINFRFRLKVSISEENPNKLPNTFGTL